MFNSFIALCKDETPLVRRIAADNVAHWTEWASTIEMQNELITILKTSIIDEQVSFYFYLLSYCEIIVKMLSYEFPPLSVTILLLLSCSFPQCYYYHRIPSEFKQLLLVSRLLKLFPMRWRYVIVKAYIEHYFRSTNIRFHFVLLLVLIMINHSESVLNHQHHFILYSFTLASTRLLKFFQL